MVYGTTAKILGDTKTYKLSTNVRRFPLRDAGFIGS